jgi:hypothetical protein
VKYLITEESVRPPLPLKKISALSYFTASVLHTSSKKGIPLFPAEKAVGGPLKFFLNDPQVILSTSKCFKMTPFAITSIGEQFCLKTIFNFQKKNVRALKKPYICPSYLKSCGEH